MPSTIKLITNGLSTECFDQLAQRMELSKRQLAAMLGISTATVARRKKSGLFDISVSERIVRLMQVFQKSVELFGGDVASARRWLKTPDDRLFEGKTPLEYAENEPGAQYVLRVIGRLEHGVYI